MLLTRTSRGEYDVTDLHDTLGASGACLYNDTRVALRLEIAASSEDDRPCLSDNLSSLRNRDRVRDVVYTRIEENDLASSVL